MTKLSNIAGAGLFALTIAAMAAPATATTPVTSDALYSYCQAEKQRRGHGSAELGEIVVAVDRWGAPDLRCRLSAPEKSRWLTALPASVCQAVAGNSRWFMSAYRVHCGSPDAVNHEQKPPAELLQVELPERKRL